MFLRALTFSRLPRFLLCFWLLTQIFHPAASLAAQPLVFVSTQLHPPPESLAIRTILKNYSEEVTFTPYNGRTLTDTQSWKELLHPDLIGGTTNDFLALHSQGQLQSLAANLPYLVSLNLLPGLLDLGRASSRQQLFIPWMQATYLMIANRQSLKYLPEDADLNSLSYEQLIRWAANIERQTGKKKVGFPAGENGLMHRFLQGFLYPSYTGSMLHDFASSDAETMWHDFDSLWQHCNIHSLSFSSMHEPLQSGEVWVGWDHTARIHRLLKDQPDQFITFPAPAGPKGRGSLLVLAGLAIPSGIPTERVMYLIDYLLQADVQLQILIDTGFLPVTGDIVAQRLTRDLQQLIDSTARQLQAQDAIVTTLPYVNGEAGATFNQIYLNSFTRIILRHQDVTQILQEQTEKLKRLIESSGMLCSARGTSRIIPCEVGP